jgi:hypothetical protein
MTSVTSTLNGWKNTKKKKNEHDKNVVDTTKKEKKKDSTHHEEGRHIFIFSFLFLHPL